MRLLLALLLTLPLAVQAASVCPIGGGAVAQQAPENCVAAACSSPRFPQCTENFLPLYKSFSEADLVLVAQYIEMEAYESAVDSSPYLLAYNIERFLGGDQGLPYQLLLQGLLYDAARSYPDPVYMDNFFFEAASEINRSAPEYLPPIYAMLALVHLKTRNTERAWYFF